MLVKRALIVVDANQRWGVFHGDVKIDVGASLLLALWTMVVAGV